MNLAVAISIVVLLLGATYIQLTTKDYSQSESDLSVEEPKPSAEASLSPVNPTYNLPSTLPTAIPTYPPTVTPPPDTKESNSQYNIYPGATLVSQTENKLVLESTESPQTITDWYKSSIQSSGMNTKSFVTTSTNGAILNKLAAAGNGKNIQITIEKKLDQTVTSITIEQ